MRSWPPSSVIRNIPFGRASVTSPSISILSSFVAIARCVVSVYQTSRTRAVQLSAPAGFAEMADEPRRGEVSDLLERARLLEEMRRARDDGELVLAAQEGRGLAVEFEDDVVPAADDEKRGRLDEPHARRGHVGASAARDDGSDLPAELRPRPERCSRSRARAG